MHKPQIEPTHENLVRTLKSMGLSHQETQGRYEQPERSVIVYNPSRDQMAQLGKLFGLDSVVFSQGHKHELLYTNGVHEGKSRLTKPGPDAIQHFPDAPEDYYTHLPGNGYFRINFDFDKDPEHQTPELAKGWPRNPQENAENAGVHGILRDHLLMDHSAKETAHDVTSPAAKTRVGVTDILNNPYVGNPQTVSGSVLGVPPGDPKNTFRAGLGWGGRGAGIGPALANCAHCGASRDQNTSGGTGTLCPTCDNKALDGVAALGYAASRNVQKDPWSDSTTNPLDAEPGPRALNDYTGVTPSVTHDLPPVDTKAVDAAIKAARSPIMKRAKLQKALPRTPQENADNAGVHGILRDHLLLDHGGKETEVGVQGTVTPKNGRLFTYGAEEAGQQADRANTTQLATRGLSAMPPEPATRGNLESVGKLQDERWWSNVDQAAGPVQPLEHPNAYPWHEGHTDHHQTAPNADVIAKSFGLQKALPRSPEENQDNALAHDVLHDLMTELGAKQTEHGEHQNQAVKLVRPVNEVHDPMALDTAETANVQQLGRQKLFASPGEPANGPTYNGPPGQAEGRWWANVDQASKLAAMSATEHDSPAVRAHLNHKMDKKVDWAIRRARSPILNKALPHNSQAAGAGVSTYGRYAAPYGHIQPGTHTDLTHYDYHGKLPEIEGLVKKHGFQVYYAGGKYGQPDLAQKNYNTGHLMVYDPTPASGGDFNNENYTKAWRQIHELSHALTYPELNSIYGEGRRIGKLGIHRIPNEAARAVHWEWLAAHKQRELGAKIGIQVPDETFHKELNTVMHDAVHRAITGQFTEPSQEGFSPHSHKVPLSTALDLVREHAQSMGIQHPHGLAARKSLAKSLPGQLHGDVGNFMAGLKGLPKDGPHRGKFITAHMNHPPFLAALQAHPQGKQIHATLTNYLNSPANAGPARVAQVTAKNEPDVILPKQGSNMSDKTYSPQEAAEILKKAATDKIKALEVELQTLRKRELGKAVIPPHKHNTGLSVSAGVEDVPPGKINPKGKDDPFKGKGVVEKEEMSPEETSEGSKSDLCKVCKAAMCKCAAKAELTDAKGNHTSNGVDPDSTLPEDAKSKKVPAEGSGGKIKKGVGAIRKSAMDMAKSAKPPMAKPPSGNNMATAVPSSKPGVMKAVDKVVVHGSAEKPKVPVKDREYSTRVEDSKIVHEAKGPKEMEKGVMSDVAHRESAQMGAAIPKPGAGPKLPSPEQHADRAAGFASAMAGDYQPPAPGKLASPKAAGIATPKPVLNAARPQTNKPGIFGKLLGKK